MGWRPEGGPADTIAAFAVFLLFSYAMSWGCACLGILSKGPESAQGIALGILFPRAPPHPPLAPRHRPHRRRPPALPQPQPLRHDRRLADATPHRHLAPLVAHA